MKNKRDPEKLNPIQSGRLTKTISRLFALTILLLTIGPVTTTAQSWVPVGYSDWLGQSSGQGMIKSLIGGQGPHNYPTDLGSWAEINDRFIVTPDSFYCHTAILRTTVYPNGSTRITVKHHENLFSVTQELVGLGWINSATWAHQWLDNSMSFNSPVVDSNIVGWSSVSLGVNYSITKVHTGVQHSVSFKPAFLDSAIVLYNQRSDSADIGLANLFKYTFDNLTEADSAIGNVSHRQFKQIGNKLFGLSKQHLFFTGWDDTTAAGELVNPIVPVRQFWKRIGTELYCLEWVSMGAVKQAHLANPTDNIWHNIADTLTSDTTEFKDSWLSSWSPNNNNGSSAELSAGHSFLNNGFGNAFIWANFATDPEWQLVACSLRFKVSSGGGVNDTLIILPADRTLTPNLSDYIGIGDNQAAMGEMTWWAWYDTSSFTYDTAWGTAGGDWLTSATDTLGKVYVPASGGTGWYTVALDSSYLNSIVTGEYVNNGFFVVTKDRTASLESLKKIYSTEGSASNRPSIEYFYTTPTLNHIWASSLADSGDGGWAPVGTTDSVDAITGGDENRYIITSYDITLDSNGAASDIVYNLHDLSLTTIDSVLLFTRANRIAFNDSLASLWQAGLIVGTDTTWGKLLSSIPVIDIKDTITNPAGGEWSQSDFNNAKFIFRTHGDTSWSFGAEHVILYRMYLMVYGSTGGDAIFSRRRKIVTLGAQ